MNNGKYDTLQYKQLQEEKNTRRFGPVIEHTKTCLKCNKEFVWTGRLKTKEYENAKYCSRSCANNRSEWWDKNLKHYRTVALKHWEEQCAICSFSKVVAIHHIDLDHSNNDPKNLIPLCPNHHEMVHSKWRFEVQPLIDELVRAKWGCSANGNTSDLHSEVEGSIPSNSTKTLKDTR